MSVFVLDASVVIKWFVPEIHSEAEARLLETNNQYLAPDLHNTDIATLVERHYWSRARV